jgi:hypothetical protein
MRRTAFVTAAAVLVVALAAGCGSGSSNTGTSTTTKASNSTTTKAVTPTTVATAHCTSSQLELSLGQADAGAGQVYVPIIFTNTGSKPCEMRGFPGVSLLDQNNSQIGQPATRDGAEGSTVTLAANGTADALLHTSNGIGGSATCTPASTSIRVYPPDNTEALIIRSAFVACGAMSIGTVVTGATGR